MSDRSPIEWTDATWNPTVGCSIVSPGCTNCYAMKMAARLEAMGQPIYVGMTQPSKAGAVWTGKVELSNHGQLIKPLSWKRPRRIFVNSMSDLFHEALPNEVIDKVFDVMALCPQHTFQVLTKRAGRMRDYIITTRDRRVHWPLPNVWLGVSTERQEEADERIPLLLKTPAAVHFISAEPLLGPIDLTRVEDKYYIDATSVLDWVIVGGESGHNARPMHPQWARDIRDQCAAADVPFFFKQWGNNVPAELSIRRGNMAWRIDPREPIKFSKVRKKEAGRLLDGREWNEFPKSPTAERDAA